MAGITAPFNSFTFTGQMYDDKSSLINMNARWYDPNAGRFMTEDTYRGDLVNPLSQHQYAYVMNNPINYIDPTGHVPEWVGQSSHSESSDYLGYILKQKWTLQDIYTKSNTGLNLVNTVEETRGTHYYYEGRRVKGYDYLYEWEATTPGGTTIFSGDSNQTYTKTSVYHDYKYVSAQEKSAQNQEVIKNKYDIPEDMEPTWVYGTLDGEVIGNEVLLEYNLSEKDPSTAILQSHINDILGKDIAVDGYFGPQTEAALKELQSTLGLSQTGVFDTKTLHQLANFKIIAVAKDMEGPAPVEVYLGDKPDLTIEVPKQEVKLSNTIALGIGATTSALLADDVTIVGVADDSLIPFVIIGGAIVWGGVKVYEAVTEEDDIPVIPDIDYPGDDPTQPPSEDYEWRGSGSPSSGKGSWYNPRTGESLHPDLNHPDPIGPHWDYKAPDGTSYRVNPDGTIIPK